MFNKLKQIQDLRKKAKELQGNLAQDTVTGESLNGQIKITMDGNQKIQDISIDENILTPENKQMIEKGLVDAFEKAIKDVQGLMAQKLQSGEINIPNIS